MVSRKVSTIWIVGLTAICLFLFAPVSDPAFFADDAVREEGEVDFVGPTADGERPPPATWSAQQDWPVLVPDRKVVIRTWCPAILNIKQSEFYLDDFASCDLEDINFVERVIIVTDRNAIVRDAVTITITVAITIIVAIAITIIVAIAITIATAIAVAVVWSWHISTWRQHSWQIKNNYLHAIVNIQKQYCSPSWPHNSLPTTGCQSPCPDSERHLNCNFASKDFSPQALMIEGPLSQPQFLQLVSISEILYSQSSAWTVCPLRLKSLLARKHCSPG